MNISFRPIILSCPRDRSKHDEIIELSSEDQSHYMDETRCMLWSDGDNDFYLKDLFIMNVHKNDTFWNSKSIPLLPHMYTYFNQSGNYIVIKDSDEDYVSIIPKPELIRDHIVTCYYGKSIFIVKLKDDKENECKNEK